MPKLTEQEVKAKIADGSIFAISIDTEVFDKYGCNLDFAVLKKLDQFAGGETFAPTQVYWSGIRVPSVNAGLET